MKKASKKLNIQSSILINKKSEYWLFASLKKQIHTDNFATAVLGYFGRFKGSLKERICEFSLQLLFLECGDSLFALAFLVARVKVFHEQVDMTLLFDESVHLFDELLKLLFMH